MLFRLLCLPISPRNSFVSPTSYLEVAGNAFILVLEILDPRNEASSFVGVGSREESYEFRMFPAYQTDEILQAVRIGAISEEEALQSVSIL